MEKATTQTNALLHLCDSEADMSWDVEKGEEGLVEATELNALVEKKKDNRAGENDKAVRDELSNSLLDLPIRR